jgi:flagellum-specific ATP synthase
MGTNSGRDKGPAGPQGALRKLAAVVPHAVVHEPRGVVVNVVGLLAEVAGISAAVGDGLRVEVPNKQPLELQVVGFRNGHVLAMPLGTLSGVRPGTRVRWIGHEASLRVGDDLLGRVLDPFGRPLDGSVAHATDRYALDADPPSPFERKPVDKPFVTGVRVLDTLLTIGEGQRLGIFAGAGVGKSTLLGQICRTSVADVNVVGLVGERGRELNDFVRHSLGPEGLKKSVVVAATSDQSPLMRARGAMAATSIAEYFRDRGKRVLLVMDSVTRFAMALRETALAAGEPPATKGYPPSVFAALPRLLERSGNGSGTGSITALYTVFVEGDDLTDPIADAVRGILDGHIVMSRALAEKGHFPAVDVLQSVSRLASELTDAGQRSLAMRAREVLGTYRDVQDLIQVGAYVKGSDPKVDEAVAIVPAVETFVKQPVTEATPVGQAWARLAVSLKGKGA